MSDQKKFLHYGHTFYRSEAVLGQIAARAQL
jgi:hypothetical protein